LGLSTLSPPAGQRRGGHISLQHEKGYEIVQALAEKGRKADFRAPETIRLGFSPLFLSYADVWDTMEDLAAILNQRLWDRPHFAKRGKVT
jgi:kynureninase